MPQPEEPFPTTNPEKSAHSGKNGNSSDSYDDEIESSAPAAMSKNENLVGSASTEDFTAFIVIFLFFGLCCILLALVFVVIVLYYTRKIRHTRKLLRDRNAGSSREGNSISVADPHFDMFVSGSRNYNDLSRQHSRENISCV
jgi:hypothetical protein